MSASAPEAPPAYTPPSQDFQRQQQEEQYKIMQQYQQQQQRTQQPLSPPPPQPIPVNPYSYGTYPQRIVLTPPITNQQIIYVGGCPACRVGMLEDDFSLLGLCCAIVFFPIGLLCCLVLREKRCSNCGAVFG